MFNKIYTLLIEPQAENPDQKNREIVLNWLIAGLGFLLAIFSLNSFVALVFDQQAYTKVPSLIMINVVLAAIVAYCLLLRKKKYAYIIASNLLIISLIMAAGIAIFVWGITNTYGVLFFSLAIIMSGILLSSRYALYVAMVIAVLLIIFEYCRTHNIIHPDLSWISAPSSLEEVANFITIFFIIALVSWLFNRQMEESLKRAQLSEKALKRERDLLEIKVEERTRALQEAQLEKVQQVYRFAELGHLSTALFHDLAGSLSSLSIDIESLRKKGSQDFTKRIDNNIRYIDNVVQRVKSQIQGKDNVEIFDVLAETKDLVGILSYNARKARTRIALEMDQDRPIMFTGNLTRFRQLIINLLSNAIEAYPPSTTSSAKERPVIIKVLDEKDTITIQVTDYGKGIQKATQTKIFDPFYSTKASGSGIGLFIVKQVAEKDFSGKIKLESNKKTGTTFTVTIPK